MLSKQQQEWVNHLSNSEVVRIQPYNPKSRILFIKQKKELLEILDRKSLIVHRGASGLGISGKGELDIYVPVSLEHFDSILKLLINAYGKPGSLYPEERARFNRKIEDIPVEIFLINREGEGMGWRK